VIRAAAALALLGASAPGAARAERGLHGSAGAGGALLATGARGDRARGDRARIDAAVDVKLRGRLGVLAAWRAWDREHRGIVTAGAVYEAGAARPRLVLDLHADLGADLDARAPVAGGGLRATLAIAGPIGAVLDGCALLAIDGVEHTRLQLQGSALVAVRW
jgi:hypothetical protein